MIDDEIQFFIQDMCQDDIDESIQLINELKHHINMIFDTINTYNFESNIIAEELHKLSGATGLMGLNTLNCMFKKTPLNKQDHTPESIGTMKYNVDLLIENYIFSINKSRVQ